jgi:phosphoribosylanthranilate isomerase
MFIKVCGLTTEEQVDWAIELRYDAIGVVATPRSKRCCSPERALALARHARQGRIRSFVVAYQYEEIKALASAFDVVQLYEWADIPNLAYSSSSRPPPHRRPAYFFYDASVGSGVYAAIPQWVSEVEGQVVIAGGLNSANVASVIAQYRPFGVDVSSSLETAPGVKRRDLMDAFARNVRKAAP